MILMAEIAAELHSRAHLPGPMRDCRAPTCWRTREAVANAIIARVLEQRKRRTTAHRGIEG